MKKIPFVIDAQTIEFPMLCLDEYTQVEEAVRSARKSEIKDMLDSCGVKGNDRFVVLEKSRPEQVLQGHVLVYLEQSAGARKVLSMSLSKAGKDSDAISAVLREIDIQSASILAAQLLGLLPEEGEKKSPLTEAGGGGS